jgi:peptide chain release factor 1
MKNDELVVRVVDDRKHSGGQTVGATPRTVEVTHTPTGLKASCGFGRSQLHNKKIAVSMIEWGLLELGIEK